MVWNAGLLTPEQAALVTAWLPDPLLEADLSWGQVDTRVLRVRTSEGVVIVKAAGDANHHIRREIDAHEQAVHVWEDVGLSGRLRNADRVANLLVREHVPGRLVEGTPAELSADVHRQAGAALRLLHAAGARTDDDYDSRLIARARRSLAGEHRISPETIAAVHARLDAYAPMPAVLVPTHGDWQPRNWLIDDGRVRVIDFGRFDFRSASSDLCRLTVQQWRDAPELESAFLDGYGRDPRVESRWSLELLCEAVGTATWAFMIGDDAFEAQGHRMLADALRRD